MLTKPIKLIEVKIWLISPAKRKLNQCAQKPNRLIIITIRKKVVSGTVITMIIKILEKIF